MTLVRKVTRLKLRDPSYFNNCIPLDAKYPPKLCKVQKKTTRMVQLPATVAIEYVAASWVSGAGGFLSGGAFVRGGGLLSGVLMPVPPKFNAYTNRLGFLCLAS